MYVHPSGSDVNLFNTTCLCQNKIQDYSVIIGISYSTQKYMFRERNWITASVVHLNFLVTFEIRLNSNCDDIAIY